MKSYNTYTVILILMLFLGCKGEKRQVSRSAADILGNANYQAISYGGYRAKSREQQPTIAQIKEDMKLLVAMDIKLLRTYNVHLPQAENLLRAISELKQEDENFEMYVMLGAWIDCKNAWTDKEPVHTEESKRNATEITKAVALAKAYPDIVKVIAVGNEAMVRWATSYYVAPKIILKWVNYLQDLKKSGELREDLWITSSDDFASWGGGNKSYHTADLAKLVKAVDYISMHTYPMHNTYYNPEFWVVPDSEKYLSDKEKIDAAMQRAIYFAQKQYRAVADYMKKLGVEKPIHIGETGWTTVSNGHYGAEQSRAADEYKAGVYYNLMREWTNKSHISCFYFEAFDEQWKDADNAKGSENHFGLINLQGEAKYAVWKYVDKGAFENLKRDGNSITKTYNGDEEALLKEVLAPPTAKIFEGHKK